MRPWAVAVANKSNSPPSLSKESSVLCTNHLVIFSTMYLQYSKHNPYNPFRRTSHHHHHLGQFLFTVAGDIPSVLMLITSFMAALLRRYKWIRGKSIIDHCPQGITTHPLAVSILCFARGYLSHHGPKWRPYPGFTRARTTTCSYMLLNHGRILGCSINQALMMSPRLGADRQVDKFEAFN